MFSPTIMRGPALAIAAALLTGEIALSDAGAAEDVWAQLKKPGRIVLVRHANAPDGPTESDDMDFKNCAIQRNLDQAGRTQARRIGDLFRQHGIRQVRLIASQYCRSVDTAKLTRLGAVQQSAVLNMVYLGNPAKMQDAAARTRQLMKSLPAKQVAVLVTHVGNIQAIAGVAVASGEMVVVHLDPSGAVVLDGRIPAP
jgi:phosphohistidine phosphatase SixA